MGGRVSTLQTSLKLNCMREFELLGTSEEKPNPLLLDRLRSCCSVIDALGLKVEPRRLHRLHISWVFFVVGIYGSHYFRFFLGDSSIGSPTNDICNAGNHPQFAFGVSNLVCMAASG